MNSREALKELKHLVLVIEAIDKALIEDICNGHVQEHLHKAQRELHAQVKIIIEALSLTPDENSIEYDAIPF